MTSRRQLIAGLAAFALSGLVLCGCGGGSSSPQTTHGSPATSAPAQPVTPVRGAGNTVAPAGGGSAGPAAAAAASSATQQLSGIDQLLNQADGAAAQTTPDPGQEGTAP